MIFSLPVQAAEIARKHIPDAEFVGEGRLTYMFWDVYDASLFAPGGDWEPGEPLALELIYLRDITGKQIADRSLDEMEDLGMDDSVRLNEWYNDMVRIFPDVTDGFVLTGVLTPRGETVFYKHDQEIGRVADPEFGHYFFDIWLSAETSAPDLRAKLLGRNKS
ncbi:MAG: chalcone isomerase family protein [Pseudomonadota bacterium]